MFILFSPTHRFFVFLSHFLGDFLNCVFHHLFIPAFIYLLSKSSCLPLVCTIFSPSKKLMIFCQFSYCIVSFFLQSVAFSFFFLLFVFYVKTLPHMFSNPDYQFIFKDRGLKHWLEDLSMKDNYWMWASQ